MLVTGAGGFIGSHLVESLVEGGADVLAMDRFSMCGYNNLQRVKNSVSILDADICDGIKIDAKFDCIFHLAALASPVVCEKNPKDAFRINVHGTYETLSFALKSESKRVLFPSSALLYGKTPRRIPIDESHPVYAVDNVYSITKKLGEEMCKAFHDTGKLEVVVVRLFNTFGPRQKEDYLLPTIILQAMNNKVIELWSDKPTRNFNYVSNTVQGILIASEKGQSGRIYNIGSEEEIRIGELAQKIAKEFGAEVKFLNKETVGSSRLSCDRTLMGTLGWKPRVSFFEGLELTINWYRSMRH